MGINIFEGARRIAKLVTLLWLVAGTSFFILIQSDPYITAVYKVSVTDRGLDPSYQCRKSVTLDDLIEDTTVTTDDIIEDIVVITKKGTQAHITLCIPSAMKKSFVTLPSGVKYVVTSPRVATEQEIVSYAQEIAEFEDRLKKERSVGSSASAKRHKSWGGDDPIVSEWEGQAFAERIKKTLKLSQADEKWIDDQWWENWWEQSRQGLLILVSGMAFLWILTWSTGWIVRGFLGIPRGQDHKSM